MANMLYVSWLHSSTVRLQAQSLRSEGASVQRLGSAGCGFVGVCGWLLALLLSVLEPRFLQTIDYKSITQ
jgi:hypothetical protein